jgi:hypothetical protein
MKTANMGNRTTHTRATAPNKGNRTEQGQPHRTRATASNKGNRTEQGQPHRTRATAPNKGNRKGCPYVTPTVVKYVISTNQNPNFVDY